MTETPWLSIVGIGEDGPDGLTPASRAALDRAEIIMGPPRHLALLGDVPARCVEWPVPFDDGIEILKGFAGRKVAVLVSGDPFWFGAGSVLARSFARDEWTAYPQVSVFSLAASRLGWRLEHVLCHGLHAAPVARLRPDLAPGRRLIVTLRDGAAVQLLADYLCDAGFGTSTLWVLSSLGGPEEHILTCQADAFDATDIRHPVCAAIEVAGQGTEITLVAGRSDAVFEHDGQITKRPVRALTLSALAPRHGEHLWDIGGGSGSVAIEWLLSDCSLSATTIEANAERAARITANAARLGVDRLSVVQGRAPGSLDGLPDPQAVFIGGGLDAAMLDDVLSRVSLGTRIVANSVTLESDGVLEQAHGRLGGDLMRVDIASAQPLGRKRGWKASFPITQWSFVT